MHFMIIHRSRKLASWISKLWMCKTSWKPRKMLKMRSHRQRRHRQAAESSSLCQRDRRIIKKLSNHLRVPFCRPRRVSPAQSRIAAWDHWGWVGNFNGFTSRRSKTFTKNLLQAIHRWHFLVPTCWRRRNTRISWDLVHMCFTKVARRNYTPMHRRFDRWLLSAWAPPMVVEWWSERFQTHRQNCWATSVHQRE